MTNAEKLAEAEAALHKLRMGEGVSYVTVGGRTIGYTQAQMEDLKAYVAELTSAVAKEQNTFDNRRRPFRFQLG